MRSTHVHVECRKLIPLLENVFVKKVVVFVRTFATSKKHATSFQEFNQPLRSLPLSHRTEMNMLRRWNNVPLLHKTFIKKVKLLNTELVSSFKVRSTSLQVLVNK